MKKPVVKSAAYDDGFRAYVTGQPFECPYEHGTAIRRSDWFSGYLDARSTDRLNLKYPHAECAGK